MSLPSTVDSTAPVTMEKQLAPAETASKSASDPDSRASKNWAWYKNMGPGLVTGAADDDPSGIATYSQAGAQFGFGMAWTLLLTYPLMVSIQTISAKIGCVSGHGLATNIRRHYPAPLLHALVGLLLLANIINIAADIAAMGDALALIVPGPAHFYALGFGLASLLLQVFVPYTKYVRVLKWLTLVLFSYFAIAMVVHVPWPEVLRAAVLPQLSWRPEYVTMVVAVFGTTISPYLFFWQASQEVEDQRAEPSSPSMKTAPHLAPQNFRRIKADTMVGMGVSNLVAFFVMLTTAVTLHAHGKLSIDTAAQAASALRPVAGDFAFFLFAIGIIGTGLLAVPVLAGSAAYALAGAFGWASSLELRPRLAKKFYAIIALATLAGVALCFTHINPMRALYWSAVVNGVIAVPIMLVMLLLATKRDVMGEFTLSPRLKAMGYLCTAVMALAVGAMFWTMALPG